MLLGSTVLQPTQAQSPSIEELEQRLQKAKEDKARRDAAAAKASADAARTSSERKSQEARLATVVVQSDAPCALSMNGDAVGNIQAGISKHRVSPGQKLVSCVSSEEKVAFEGELEARSGQDTVLRITLAERVQAAQRSRREAEEKVQRERREAEERKAACDRGGPSMIVATGDQNVLQQCSSDRLFWTRTENGRDVNWSQAQAHCQGLGSGWSLPTAAQLQSLYDKNLPGIPCGSYSCKVSNQFRLSGYWFWSSESNGSSEAWNVYLDNGYRYSLPVGHSLSRALCVRRP